MKCLITGAAGNIGIALIEELLKSKKYEITAMDLNSPRSQKRLKKFTKDINIIYADINDEKLLSDFLKNVDVVFHLAGVLPFNAEINDSLANIVNYEGSKNLIDILKEYNPKAYLIYPSTTCIYGDVKRVKLSNGLNIFENDYFAINHYKVEEYITNNLKNYTIYRLPFVLNSLSFDKFMYNLVLNRRIEVITVQNVAKAFVNTLSYKNKLNQKIHILSGGNNYRTTSNKLMYEVLKINGICFRYCVMYHFLSKNFYVHYYEDEGLNQILDYQSGNIEEYYQEIQHLRKRRRFLQRFFAKVILHKLAQNKKNNINK